MQEIFLDLKKNNNKIEDTTVKDIRKLKKENEAIKSRITDI